MENDNAVTNDRSSATSKLVELGYELLLPRPRPILQTGHPAISVCFRKLARWWKAVRVQMRKSSPKRRRILKDFKTINFLDGLKQLEYDRIKRIEGDCIKKKKLRFIQNVFLLLLYKPCFYFKHGTTIV